MKKYIAEDPWKIIENKFDSHLHPNSESLFSIGNGRMGQRANFEEDYSGESLSGNYIGGVYYPDKTRVGWWKNGYPEYFAKVLNAVKWTGLNISIDGELVDLAKNKVISFKRELDMRTGILKRDCTVQLSNEHIIHIQSERFYSLYNQNWAFLRYEIATEKAARIQITSYLDFNVYNSDANYDDDFWHLREQQVSDQFSYVKATTKKTAFDVAAAQITGCATADLTVITREKSSTEGYACSSYKFDAVANQSIEISKAVAIHSSFYEEKKDLERITIASVEEANTLGFEKAKAAQKEIWAQRWDHCDIKIEGDVAAQQGIRFNIFQLYQTYSGEDPRLNIGPKGFTGEKYGGSTYWDTEAYCLPFYLSIAAPEVARSLVVYRHNHLQKAIENASKLGFKDGAALYPMVTMNGEECHNEWEITFEEIHRNGAIAYGIYDYINYTGDEAYLLSHGLSVLIGIARFWVQRVNWSEAKKKYVMLGVTGPNEYENNVNNNWYTNYIARWCLIYTKTAIAKTKDTDAIKLNNLLEQLNFKNEEIETWQDIIDNFYLPEDDVLGIYLQQDGFLDKEQLTVKDLEDKDRPINQKWSWDRILRSIFIKQADVLQGFYFFEDDFTIDQLRKNFEYYEPRTVHESSLSPCVHSILAAKLGMEEKAYEMYLRTARLDLDDYNNDTEDGCHITSMAGTWLSIVKGFGGMRATEKGLTFKPFLPKKWKSYSFKINYRGQVVGLSVTKEKSIVTNYSDKAISLTINEKNITINAHQSIES